jgi:ribosome biogenesis protein SSF1/2
MYESLCYVCLEPQNVYEQVQKKKRTHREPAADPSVKGPPKSFVWAQGSNRSLVREICADVRTMMRPHTAVNLKVSNHNVMKDFIHVAGPLGVTHFVIVTASDKASYLKLCKSPRVRLVPLSGPQLIRQTSQS